jgi:creatinine amidohydrolase
MRWELLTPPDFKKLAKEEKVCVVPMGALERHGDHLPLGTDALIAHRVACAAAETEPCVVFPPYWFGQLHEASCFTGTIALSPRLLVELLEEVLGEIARNGLKKILIYSAHGGNNSFLDFFAISHVDRETGYSLYIIHAAPPKGEHVSTVQHLLKTQPIGHACEYETSMMMAIVPQSVHMEYQKIPEPILPLKRLEKLKDITSGFWWYADYPDHVIGCPSAGSKETGEQFLKAMAKDLAVSIKKIKDDTVMEELQKDFLDKRNAIGMRNL